MHIIYLSQLTNSSDFLIPIRFKTDFFFLQSVNSCLLRLLTESVWGWGEERDGIGVKGLRCLFYGRVRGRRLGCEGYMRLHPCRGGIRRGGRG